MTEHELARFANYPGSAEGIPEYLRATVLRPVPPRAPVVPGSTPVVAFGDFRQAEVATLGINPSAAEFTANGQLLTGMRRRLATLQSLGLKSLHEATDEHVATVIADCVGYFHRHPYWRWFRPLEALLQQALGVSYLKATACHLDLVQWATNPVWGRLSDRAVRDELLVDGVEHLKRQLDSESVRVVLCNGRQVINRVVGFGLAPLEQVDELSFGGDGNCRLYSATSAGVRFLGWSTNLQSSFGVTREFRQRLAGWIATAVRTPHGEEAPSVSEAYVVQFPHPGPEHSPQDAVLPWNQGDHRRKFLVSKGVAEDADGQPKPGRYVFWGGWEAQSRVMERWPPRAGYRGTCTSPTGHRHRKDSGRTPTRGCSGTDSATATASNSPLVPTAMPPRCRSSRAARSCCSAARSMGSSPSIPCSSSPPPPDTSRRSRRARHGRGVHHLHLG